MAKNTGKGSRKGAVKDRTQFPNPNAGGHSKRDTKTGRIVENSPNKFKGVRREDSKD